MNFKQNRHERPNSAPLGLFRSSETTREKNDSKIHHQGKPKFIQDRNNDKSGKSEHQDRRE